MLVRTVYPEEMPHVGELRVRTYLDQGLLDPDSPYLPVLRALGTSGIGDVLVAVDGDELLGTVTLRPFQEDSEIMVAAQRLYASEGFVRLPERDWSPQPGVPLLAYGLRLSARGQE